MRVNAQYNVARPNSLPITIAVHQRRKMLTAFLRVMHVSADDTILDIGATSDCTYADSNYLEAWYPHRRRITAVGIDDVAVIETIYPGTKFVRADGLDLPFKSGCFDYVHSSAVLEHVGQHCQQIRLLREMWRVARAGIFVTTPNRWFPVEFHTLLPLLHWLPGSVYRRVLRALGLEFFAAEENLNLLSRRSLGDAARVAGIERFSISVVSLLSLPTNLLLTAHKQPSRAITGG